MNAIPSSSGALVVGTGTAGLATALALARQGIPVSLLGPRAPIPAAAGDTYDPRVYAVSPASQAFLAKLGVWDLLPPERIARIESMDVMGAAPSTAPVLTDDAPSSSAASTSSTPGRIQLSAWQGNLPALAWVVEGRELERVLRQAVGVLGVAWTQERFVALGMGDPSAPLEVTTDAGRILRTELAIGADGAESPLRKAAGLSSHGSDYEATGLVVHLDVEQPHQGVALQWFTPDGVLALLPMPDTADGAQVSMVWSMETTQANALLALPAAEQASALAARLQTVAGDRVGRIRVRGTLHGFPLRVRSANPMVMARVALVGDAAHLIHPLAGQGLNLGLGDAAGLAAAITEREHFRRIGDLRVLRRYARARAPALLAMRAATDGLYRLFTPQDPLLGWVRNTGMALVDRLPPIKRALIAGASKF
ncbi:ubiquinone biosynthesis protein UbiH [Pigmentiphaga aceris]|uniref:Ubiquinone biosynthesis protein UbiH n=1 Tax=Pigmentiphaga aceris TaxID=1940612 RepID=A0A5C0AS70_9BURK|nr:FAD-dependent monooxygenase [Pigmentiphaga aceris]QEI05008.1 ubiquinone biosynthesis protein UbiH [Pigmentiphaga aceris]